MRRVWVAGILIGLLTGCDPHQRPGADVQPVPAGASAASDIKPRTYPAQTNTAPVGWQPPVQPPARVAVVSPSPPAAATAPGNGVASLPATKPPPQTLEMNNPPVPAGYVPSVGPRPESPGMTAGKPAPSTSAGKWHAHLASHRNEEAAIRDWQQRLKASPQVYADLEPSLVWVDLPNRGPFARLVVGEFSARAEADALCGRIRSSVRYCTPVQE
jgi:hypothetical protein